jgi:hypothetical protein
MHIHCPSVAPVHLVVGHFGAAALLVLAAACWPRARR